jgi:hypothetical protein
MPRTIRTEFTSSTDISDLRPRRHHWPALPLNVWLFVSIVGASLNLGVFAYFITVQNTLGLGIPWYFPYVITVAAVTLAWILLKLWLISRKVLLPGPVLLASFMLTVLWLTATIIIGIQLWGAGNINASCMALTPSSGASETTLAWLQQQSICTYSVRPVGVN